MNINKLISLALALLLCFETVGFAAAAETATDPYVPKYTEDADLLYELGLWHGVGTNADGTPNYNLEGRLTRLQMIVVILRLLGLEDEALATTARNPFVDMQNSWGSRYLAYAYEIGMTTGVGNNRFGDDYATPLQFSTMMLRAMGYSDKNGDFTYQQALEKATEIGIVPVGMFDDANGELLRDCCVKICATALTTKLNGEKRTLAEKLIDDNVIQKETAERVGVYHTKQALPTYLFPTGLALSSYDNQGAAYSDWWNQSEICTFLPLSGRYLSGACGVTVYIRDGELKDGEYAVGISMCENGNPFNLLSYKDLSFAIQDGEVMFSDHSIAHERINEGYLIYITCGYKSAAPGAENQALCVKVYSSVNEKNGAIYFGDFFVADEARGLMYPDLEKLSDGITSFNLRSGITTPYRVVPMTGMGETLKSEVTLPRDQTDSALTKDADQEFFPTGFAVDLSRNAGRVYENDWWFESETIIFINRLSNAMQNRFYRGVCGFSVYVPNGYLCDGEYGLELFLRADGEDRCSPSSSHFTVSNGSVDPSRSMATVIRTKGGYLVFATSAYSSEIRTGDLELLLKVHCSSTEPNTELYLTDFFIADAISGFTFWDFSKESPKISARRPLTGEPLDDVLSLKSFGNLVNLQAYVNSLYAGEEFPIRVIGNGADIRFSSSDSSVASVTTSGVIVAHKPGNTVITVKDPVSAAETTFNLTVKEAGIDVLVDKDRVVAGDSFTYYGVGLGVTESGFTWHSSNSEVGSIDPNTGRFTGKTAGTTTLTVTGNTSGLSYSFDVQVYTVQNSDVKSYITVNANGLISAELERRVTELLYAVYPEVFDYFADGVYSPITCNFVSMDGVAYTTGDREIFVSAEYINANPNDLDCVTHELIHCAQSYPYGEPLWLLEGITDYGRHLFGKYNKEADWAIFGYEDWQNYTDSYTVTAGFLNYVVTTYDPNLIETMNQAFKNSAYSPDIWEKTTGYTIDQLWTRYSGRLIEDAPSVLYTGESLTLQLTGGYHWDDVSWTLSDSGVATLSPDGVLTALKEGTTRITVRSENGAESSWELSVKRPYIAPLTKKESVAQGTVYQYVAMGYGVKNPEFIWSSSDPSVASIDPETGLLTALKAGFTTLTLQEKTTGQTNSFTVEITQPKTIDPRDYIVFNKDPSVPDDLSDRLYQLLCDVYIDVFDYFADGEYRTIHCSFGDGGGAAAYAYGNNIVIDVNFISGNPKDIDCLTHELIHCAQMYSTYDHIWLIEGITDYGRYLFGRHNDEAGWKLQAYQDGQSYTDSYTVTGSFLKYVTEIHNENMVRILNAAFKNNAYNNRIWKDNTGYTIDELWEMYSQTSG